MVFAPNDRARAVAVSLGVLALVILFMELATMPALVVDPGVATFDPDTSRLAVMLFLPLNFVGMAVGGLVYLRLTGRLSDWLDIRRPDRSDLIWIIGGSIGAVLVLLVGGIAMQLFDTDIPPSPVIELLQDDLLLLTYMLLIVWLFNAPAEELVFRNVLQKRCYAAFSEAGAVVFASVLFTLVHLPGYVALGADLRALVIPGTVIFVGSLVMGLAYVRTRNLLAPILIHAIFNSFQIALILLAVLVGVELDHARAMVVG